MTHAELVEKVRRAICCGHVAGGCQVDSGAMKPPCCARFRTEHALAAIATIAASPLVQEDDQ